MNECNSATATLALTDWYTLAGSTVKDSKSVVTSDEMAYG